MPHHAPRLAALLLLPALAGLPTPAPAQEPAKAAARRPDIYDAKADAQVLVDRALAKARANQTRVLVMLGGNWCGWCHKLHDLFGANAAIKKLLRDEYQLVMLDTQGPNTQALLDAWKVEAKSVPYLVVLDAEGQVVCRQPTEPLEQADHHDPARVLDFLTEQQAPPVSAQAVLDAALARAAKDDKRVLLHFGAPWCGWCHRLEDFLAQPEIAALIGRDYIDLKIDTERFGGGQALLDRYCPRPGGIPWIAVLDAQGTALATSDGPQGNIGYPVETAEIGHFLGLLKATGRTLTPADLATIEAALKANAERIKAAQKPRAAN